MSGLREILAQGEPVSLDRARLANLMVNDPHQALIYAYAALAGSAHVTLDDTDLLMIKWEGAGVSRQAIEAAAFRFNGSHA